MEMYSPDFVDVIACDAIEINIIWNFPRAIWRNNTEVIQYERIPYILEE